MSPLEGFLAAGPEDGEWHRLSRREGTTGRLARHMATPKLRAGSFLSRSHPQ